VSETVPDHRPGADHSGQRPDRRRRLGASSPPSWPPGRPPLGRS